MNAEVDVNAGQAKWRRFQLFVHCTRRLPLQQAEPFLLSLTDFAVVHF